MSRHRIILLILVFMCMSLEVRVKAKDFLVQQPRHCLKTTGKCSIYVSQKSQRYLPSLKSSIVASNGSVLIRDENGEYDLIKGTFQVLAHEKIKLSTEFGQIYLDKRSSVLIEKSETNIVIYPLSNGVSLKKIESKEDKVIPVGFRYEVAAVNPQGVSESTLPQMVEVRSLIPLWDKVDIRKKKDFSDAVRTYYSQWKSSFEDYERIYSAEVEREVASDKKQKFYEEQERIRMSKQDAYLSKLFRKRYFLDQ